MKIYRNIWFFYIIAGVSISILVILGLLYMEKSRDQVQYIDAVEHTYKVLSAIDFCEKTLAAAEAAQRGYLLTGENNYKERLDVTLPMIDSSMRIINSFTEDNVGQKTYFFQLTKFVTTRVRILRENLLLKTADPLYVENLRQGVIVMDNCSYYMKKMRGVEEGLLKKRLETKVKYQRLNLSFFKATFITACLICMIAVVIFFRELSKRLTAQQNLKAKINELSNSKRELQEMTFAASHDLQEPMRKVRILSNLITKKFTGKISDERSFEAVYRINTVTEQMHGMLNDLVVYTNLFNPKERYADVNLYDLFKDVYYKSLRNENVQFQVPGKLPTIHGSKSQLETMINHLLANALKFKDPGRELTITIQHKLKPVKESIHSWEYLPSGQIHEITISDNGIGFDSQYNEKIFGLFQRLHSQSEYPGKGLGLSVSRRIMTNHKGYIVASGKKGEGASIILYFPVVG